MVIQDLNTLVDTTSSSAVSGGHVRELKNWNWVI